MVKYNPVNVVFSSGGPNDPGSPQHSPGGKIATILLDLRLQFAAFHECDEYSWQTRKRLPEGDFWPIITPMQPDTVEEGVDAAVQKMIDATWKLAEPNAGAERGATLRTNPANPLPVIGSRLQQNPGLAPTLVPQGGYHAQVRPTAPEFKVLQGNNSAIATDWEVTTGLRRANAVTFRGDSRDPQTLQAADGFKVPSSRDDPDYIKDTVAACFASYMKRRFGIKLDAREIAALLLANPLPTKNNRQPARDAELTDDEKERLYHYSVWRMLVKKEEAHIGRMAGNQTLKSFVSTSKSIDTAVHFATNGGARDAWVYVTCVDSGYVVPDIGDGTNVWGTGESEIAKFGDVPWAKIVGFRKFQARGTPVSPIFLRSSFQREEPLACADVYQTLSGKVPPQPNHSHG